MLGFASSRLLSPGWAAGGVETLWTESGGPPPAGQPCAACPITQRVFYSGSCDSSRLIQSILTWFSAGFQCTLIKEMPAASRTKLILHVFINKSKIECYLIQLYALKIRATWAAPGAETLWAESGGTLLPGQPCLARPLTFLNTLILGNVLVLLTDLSYLNVI